MKSCVKLKILQNKNLHFIKTINFFLAKIMKSIFKEFPMRIFLFSLIVLLFFGGCGGDHWGFDDAYCGYDYCYAEEDGNEALVEFYYDSWGFEDGALCYYNGVRCDYSPYCQRYGYMDYDCWKTTDISRWTNSPHDIEYYHAFNITDYGIFSKDYEFWF